MEVNNSSIFNASKMQLKLLKDIIRNIWLDNKPAIIGSIVNLLNNGAIIIAREWIRLYCNQ